MATKKPKPMKDKSGGRGKQRKPAGKPKKTPKYQ